MSTAKSFAEAESALAGVGVGLIETPRFRRALERRGSRLLERVFTPDEVAYGLRKKNGEHNFAARFAAKCAGRRVLAGLLLAPVSLRELEVVRRRSGEPTLVLRGPAAADLEARGLGFRISLTHDADFAMATVFLEAVRAASA